MLGALAGLNDGGTGVYHELSVQLKVSSIARILVSRSSQEICENVRMIEATWRSCCTIQGSYSILHDQVLMNERQPQIRRCVSVSYTFLQASFDGAVIPGQSSHEDKENTQISLPPQDTQRRT